MTENIVLGIDQGFSSIKVSSPAGEFKFANTVREVERSGNLFSLGASNVMTYEYNGKKYIVVILANRPYNSPQGKDFIVKASSLIYKAIAG